MADGAGSAYPNSWWAASTATECYPSVEGTVETEVAVIGGGFTGLAAARALQEEGIDCCVLEARRLGWGASGRTGAMAVPRYKKGFALLSKMYGAEEASRLFEILTATISDMENAITAWGVECDFRRNGHLTAAHTSVAMRALESDCAWLRTNLDDAVVELYTAEQVRDHVGTREYVGGYFDPRGAEIHPLKYVTGMGAALHARGARVYEGTPVLGVRDNGAEYIELRVPAGVIRCKNVLFAMNAYAKEAPGGRHDSIHRYFMPVNSAVIVTEAMDERSASDVMPICSAVSDTKRLMRYFRRLPDGRILFGGRGGAANGTSKAIAGRLHQEMLRIFPRLRGLDIAYSWSGRVGVSSDGFPHIIRAGKRMWCAGGYGGRGVVLSHYLGKHLAYMVTGKDVAEGPMEETPGKLMRLPVLRVPATEVAVAYYRLLDSMGR